MMMPTKRVIAALCCSSLLALAACSGPDVKQGYIGPATLDQDQVAQLLSQQGYTDVTGLHKNGSDWIGSAQKDGHQVNFDISKDGTIHTK